MRVPPAAPNIPADGFFGLEPSKLAGGRSIRPGDAISSLMDFRLRSPKLQNVGPIPTEEAKFALMA